MRYGIDAALASGLAIEYRSLYNITGDKKECGFG